ncbi:MAG: acetolactate synthase small subunit [Candidatus Desulfofervidaceae bacterium]|nr:acetolactate synthase small subunit [Candidatus Desulfofervidaceae bacterium]
MRHTLSLLVENQPGVLSRVTGLFSGRGFNIESLCVAETLDPKISRITLVTKGDDQIVEQIKKQLNKLINVIKVVDLSEIESVEREMALIKVKADPNHRAEVLRMVDIFRGKIVDVSPLYYTVEITGDANKIEAFIELMRNFQIQEIARTGTVALPRAKKIVKEEK